MFQSFNVISHRVTNDTRAEPKNPFLRGGGAEGGGGQPKKTVSASGSGASTCSKAFGSVQHSKVCIFQYSKECIQKCAYSSISVFQYSKECIRTQHSKVSLSDAFKSGPYADVKAKKPVFANGGPGVCGITFKSADVLKLKRHISPTYE